jgi:hypothetical protein
VGFRKDPRLGTRYVEIPLDYGVYLYEPILTQNIADDEISRLLVGRVTDPDLGDLEATAIFNYSPPIEPVFPTGNAVFERLELVLNLDFYSYGSTDSTDMQLTVHELEEQLTPERLYYSGTQISFKPTPVGDTTFALGPTELKNGWASASDNDATNNQHYKQPIRLSNALGQELLDDLIGDRILIDDFAQFSAKYMGFALRMPVGDKILGFSPVYTLPTPSADDSRLVLTYKESGTNVTVDFPIYYASVNGSLNPVVSFTYLAPNRTGTVVDGVAPFTDLVPSDGKIYAQSGTGILPKFDLTKVYTYFDTVLNPVINSAELVFDNTFTGRAPEDFELLLLDTLNQFRDIYADTVIGGVQQQVSDPYLLRIQTAISPYAVGTETRVAVVNEVSGATVGVDQVTGKVGLMLMTEFFQQIIDKRKSPGRARALALHPLDNEFKKTVSALKLTGSSARLRIYYSKPLAGLP